MWNFKFWKSPSSYSLTRHFICIETNTNRNLVSNLILLYSKSLSKHIQQTIGTKYIIMQKFNIHLWYTYNAFRLWRPKNILLCISAILFSDNSKSCIFDAPSNAFCSIPLIWLRRKSNFTKFGRRPNKPSDLMRPSSLSLSNLLYIIEENGKSVWIS